MPPCKPLFYLLAALVLLAACGAPAGAGAPAATVATAQATMVPAGTAAPTTEAAVATAATAAPVGTAAPPSQATAAPTATDVTLGTSTPAAAVTATTAGTAKSTGAIRLTFQNDGTQASYRAHEQLANHNVPSDAVGATRALTGSLVIQPDGTIVAHQSRFVVDMTTLQSDSRMRDGYTQHNTLQTGTYPTAVFVPTAVEGLPSPLPTSGSVNFKLNGNMTIHGVTKPLTWNVQAQIAGQSLTGTATTSFTFEDFGMAPPRTMMVLSVEDNLALEVNFHMTAVSTTS
jgi:polyisoprenoid-binding protein YceI